MANIPFHRLSLGAEEIKAMTAVIDSGWIVMGDKTAQFEEEFAKYVGSHYAVFVDSGTAALFLSLKCLEVDGEMAVPSFTFVATAEAIVNAGARPFFVDIEAETFSISHQSTKSFYQSLPVHLFGNRSSAISLVYDSAHRIERNDIEKDSSALWCYSFYATKNLTTINGGMIATNYQHYYEWLKVARDHGINRGTLERYRDGKSDYIVNFIGYREKADDVRAAIGLVQLAKLDDMNQRRREIVARYNDAFGYQREGNHNYPIFVSNRVRFEQIMRLVGIQTNIFYHPLHRMPAFKQFPRCLLPITEELAEKIISLPLYPELTDKEVDYIITNVIKSGMLLS